MFRAHLDDHEFVFLSRHGVLYSFDPGQINYRANVYALHSLGVTNVVGITSVGTCDYTHKLGSLCLLSDFIDFTKSRPASFEREHRLGLHTGMEEVFSPALKRHARIASSSSMGCPTPARDLCLHGGAAL